MPQLKNLLISTFSAAVICSSTLGQELKQGDLIWEFETESYVATSPSIGADGTVYVGSDDRNVYALDGKIGAKQWKFRTGSYVASSPAIVADGTVYVGSRDYNVYAFETSSTGPADSSWPMFSQNAQRTERAPTSVSDALQITISDKTAWSFIVSFITLEDSTYVFQASADLKNWSKVEEVNGTGDEVKVTDRREAIFQKQYYRVK
ncbi:MAG: PQQ-binding-like beta-propeller repeat protein [Verrucomicrobiota bacterium]|nr:PQQ-binding-like beta-propeller repeat protein [Verrucomicrobiota bacterium]